MKLSLFGAFPAIILLGSCASIPDAAKGINDSEMRALERTYYWKAEYDPPTFSERELQSLMDRSADPSLDGEYAEGQSSAVAVALATVGDKYFATVLATRSAEVQSAVIGNVRYMWTHYKLQYPMTQAIAAGIEQGEQGEQGEQD